MTTIWWIRRDLRLRDNPALTAACEAAERVLPVFVLDPNLLHSPWVGERRVAFLFANLRELDASLQSRGSGLIVREGEPVETLQRLLNESEARGIHAERDHSPYARRRDRAVGEALPLQLTGSSAIRPPGSVMKSDGDPYVVYSYFRDLWKEAPFPREDDLLPPPDRWAPLPDVRSEAIPESDEGHTDANFPPGEEAAQTRLADFTAPDGPITRYDERRDHLAADGTSRLSPYLRFGLISPRAAMAAARNARTRAESETARENVETWIDELIWRDFYLHVLHHFPHARRRSFREKYQELPWRNQTGQFEAWQNGRTGYPVVDAAMRQLAETGWMHNRGRMIVASFLTKDLLIDWRWGERHFMQQLLDGDPASNNGGWQWAAGTGTDAAPYFRIFNPTTQAEKHDPKGEYIRRWVPELADVPLEHLHSPWTMPDDVQAEAGCQIGQDYPAPIVDHSEARERALEAYRSVSD